MEEPRTGAADATWPLAMLLVAAGGGVVLVGVFFGWFRLSIWSSSGFFGRELLHSEVFPGTRDWTGEVAISLGAIVLLLAVASMVFAEPRVRLLAACVVVIGGLLVVAVVFIAFLRVRAVVASLATPAGASGIREASAAFGMPVSGLGGVLTALGGLVARRVAAP